MIHEVLQKVYPDCESRADQGTAQVTKTIWIAALGNFIAVFVLVLFGIVRTESLLAIGVPAEKLLATGASLLNFQMSGMLIGGLLWGIAGDKRGRLSVLVGSIVLYSIATFANAFATNIETYAALRFFAGLGLAGEFGAGITLLTEIVPKARRPHAATLVAALGMAGAVASANTSNLVPWNIAYMIGGGLGIALVGLRAGLAESSLFLSAKRTDTNRGDIRLIFKSKERLFRYLRCTLIGLPIWFIAGILMIFAPEISSSLGVDGKVSSGTSIMMHCLGGFFGNLLSGQLAHRMGARKKVVGLFLVLLAIFFLLLFSSSNISVEYFYGLCALSGVACGYFGIFAMIAAEQFGTNLRATVTTTVPNIVRGAVVPMTLLFQFLNTKVGVVNAAVVLAIAVLLMAAVALVGIKESHDRNLDFLET